MTTPPILYTATFPTPLGAFSVAVDPSGALVATAFGGLAALRRRTPGLRAVPDRSRTAEARAQIEDYFGRRRRAFALRLAPQGTAFQQRVWAELRRIPPGQTRSYGEIARTLKSSARAVGGASGRNPLCVVVPCHRVVGSDGSLTGFAFGTRIKRLLLEAEGVRLRAGEEASSA